MSDMESKGFTVEPALVKITDEGVAYVHVSNQTQSVLKLNKGDQISTAEAEVKIIDNNSTNLQSTSEYPPEKQPEHCKKLLVVLEPDETHLSALEK